MRVDAAVPYLEALVLLVDRTGKACAGCLEQHRSFLGIKALCREHRDEILGSQFRRIAEVQTMIEILQGTVTAYVISIPGRRRGRNKRLSACKCRICVAQPSWDVLLRTDGSPDGFDPKKIIFLG